MIARNKSNIMIFNSDGMFEQSGPYFSTTYIPFATELDTQLIDGMIELGCECTVRELSDLTGISLDRVRNSIYHRLQKMQWIEKMGGKKWKLKDEYV